MHGTQMLLGVITLSSLLPLYGEANVVRGESIILERDGRVGAEITYSQESTPTLFIYDESGVPRVSIGLYPDGAPGVVLNDNQGRAGAIMRLVENEGDPVLVLKENGDDKVIVDTRGRISPITSAIPVDSPFAPITLFSALFLGFFGGTLGALAVLSRQRGTSTT